MRKAETIAAVKRVCDTALENNQAKELALLNEFKRQTISK